MNLKARYLNVDLSAFKNNRIKILSITAGKLNLSNDLGQIEELAVSCMKMVNLNKTLKSMGTLNKLKFDSLDLPNVFCMPDFPKLKSLSLSFNDFSVVNFGDMPMLEELNLAYCSNLKEIQGLTHLKNMKSIDISKCVSIDSLSFLPLKSPVKLLNLTSCIRIRKFKILSRLPYLKSIILSSGLPDETLDEIKKNVKPDCKIILDI